MEKLIGRTRPDGRETRRRPREGHDTTIHRFAVDESLTIFIPFYLPSTLPAPTRTRPKSYRVLPRARLECQFNDLALPDFPIASSLNPARLGKLDYSYSLLGFNVAFQISD